MTLQDKFLSTLKIERVPVTVFLANGIKLGGAIVNFDNFSLCLEREGHIQLVYKHAISTILPLKSIKLFEQKE